MKIKRLLHTFLISKLLTWK